MSSASWWVAEENHNLHKDDLKQITTSVINAMEGVLFDTRWTTFKLQIQMRNQSTHKYWSPPMFYELCKEQEFKSAIPKCADPVLWK